MAMVPIEPLPDVVDRSAAAADGPSLVIEGLEGSALRASLTGLTLERSTATGGAQHVWPYDRIDGIRLDAYGSIGVIRARLDATGGDLPLLLLEPHQIAAARRGLEMVWNLMSARGETRQTA